MATRQELQSEIEETVLDLRAFTAARDVIRKRVIEVRDSPRLLTKLSDWSGTDAVLGSLDLSTHSIERVLEELRVSERMLPDEPRLRLVTEGTDEHES